MASADRLAIPFWLDTPNPFKLAAPPRHVGRLLTGYDKMLRVFPSQVSPVYRLVRVCRREARLGLNAMVVHDHPDTRICIQHGVLPIAQLEPWALSSPEKLLRDLRARDTWLHGGADPDKAVDTIIDNMTAAAREADAHAEAELDGELDERASTAYRWLRYGPPAWADMGALGMGADMAPITRTVDPLPLLPDPVLPS